MSNLTCHSGQDSLRLLVVVIPSRRRGTPHLVSNNGAKRRTPQRTAWHFAHALPAKLNPASATSDARPEPVKCLV